MDDCQCAGSFDRPPCSTINTRWLNFKTHEDLSGLIFNRASASRLLGLETEQQTAIPGPYKQFTLFSNLPFELRLKVWGFALSVPRLIVVSYTSVTGEDDRRVFVDTPPLPSCLSACQESRAEALKTYEKCTITSVPGSPMTYINFANDQFLLGGPDSDLDMDYLMSITAPGNSHNIRFLHVSRGCWKGFALWTHLRELFTGLEELTISFPNGAALLPYTHECWYGALSRSNKEIVVRSELYEIEDENEEIRVWQPSFRLHIVHYDSPPIKGKY